MTAVKDGVELVRKLKASHTPDGKLAPARQVLADIHAAENRVATPAEVIAKLEETWGEDHPTVAKAKQIAEKGEWEKPVTTSKPIEEVLAEKAEAEKAEAGKTAGGEPAPAPRSRPSQGNQTRPQSAQTIPG